MHTVERSSVVAVPAAEMWRRATSPDGINAELRPWLRMTVPRALRGMTIDNAPVGEVAGRSWILLFGAIPVEYDDLRLVELESGRRFLERSSMASLRIWQHERIIEPIDDRSCRLTDRLGLELRRPLAWIPGTSRFAQAIVGALFGHRHRRLARLRSASS